MPAHVIDYEIIGHDLQLLEVELDPNETVIAEAGAMNYMEDGITFQARMGDGTESGGLLGGLLGAAKRAVGGAGVFLTHFTNVGTGKKRVAFSAPYPGKIVPLNLAEFGGRFQCQRDTFLCAASGTRISISFTKRFGAGLFGGEGFILQKLEGDGLAFLHAGGVLVRKDLNGETLRVDTGSLVGFSDGIEFDIERAGNLQSMIFGGEGLFFATLRGTGTVYLQSLPFNKLAERIVAQVPPRGN
jgi:uncharacterized protein (TIGR00266 family)